MESVHVRFITNNKHAFHIAQFISTYYMYIRDLNGNLIVQK